MELDPINIHAYDRVPRSKLKVAPQKVHQIPLLVETENRVGLLRDLCSELANLGVNIVHVFSLPRPRPDMARLQITLEIRNLAQYEEVNQAIFKVEGVNNVMRIQSGEQVTPSSIDVHKEPDQSPLP